MGDTLRYQTGFGNDFATEAVPGALPVGRSNPKQPAHGLYTEELNGTAFTAPRAGNRRSWTYRIRPSAVHEPFKPLAAGLLRSAPFDEVPAPPNQLRWRPLPIPTVPTDFVAGLVTIGGNGDPALQTGAAVHLYAANTSMVDRFFYDADGELLLVPERGALLVRTELGVLHVDEIHPRCGDLHDGFARLWHRHRRILVAQHVRTTAGMHANRFHSSLR